MATGEYDVTKKPQLEQDNWETNHRTLYEDRNLHLRVGFSFKLGVAYFWWLIFGVRA